MGEFGGEVSAISLSPSQPIVSQGIFKLRVWKITGQSDVAVPSELQLWLQDGSVFTCGPQPWSLTALSIPLMK